MQKHTNGVPFWRSRLAAVAMLAALSAVAITALTARMQAFTVLDGSDRYVVSTLSADPAAAVELAGVTLGEYDAISRVDGYNELTIDRSFEVHVTVDGVTRALYMNGGTVEDALEQAGVDMAGYRLVDLQMSDAAMDGLDICLQSAVTYEEYTVSEELPYEVTVRYTGDLPQGRVQILQKGQVGTLTKVCRDTVAEDAVQSTVVLSQSRVEPVEEIRLVGTCVGAALSPAPFEIELDSAGQPVQYQKLITGMCTAYTNDRGLCGTTTSTGRPASVGVVAVDPSVIPYGSKLYIVSADGSRVYGYAIAGDTGGAAMSGRIVADLFMDTYEECVLFGRRQMNIYVLEP